MKITFQRILTEDGIEEHGLLYEPDKRTNKIIVHVHGMAGNFYENPFVQKMAEDYTNAGYSFLVFNNRGTGHITWFNTKKADKKIGNTFEIFEDCVIDIKSWVSHVEKLGYSQIVLQGHSLGCSKIAYYQWKQKNPRVKKLILFSPADMLGLVLSDPNEEPKWKRSIKLAEELVSKGKEDEILPELVWDWYYLSAKTYLNFFGKDSNLSVFPFSMPERGFNVLKEIGLPMFAILGTKDFAVITDQKECLRMLEENIENCKTHLIEGAEHTFRGYEAEVTKVILKWLK